MDYAIWSAAQSQRQTSTPPYYAQACSRLMLVLTHCITVLFIMTIHEDRQNPYIIYLLHCVNNTVFFALLLARVSFTRRTSGSKDSDHDLKLRVFT